MWYIHLLADNIYCSSFDFASIQILEKHAGTIYDSIAVKCGEDYKRLNATLEYHITKHINYMIASKIDLYVYNYGIDNAIILLNDYNNRNRKYTNTTAKNMLFAIFYSMLTITYIPHKMLGYTRNGASASAIVIIQRFWRKTLSYRKKISCDTIHNDIAFLIDKIEYEITGEPAKRVLKYLVNKFKRQLDRRLSL